MLVLSVAIFATIYKRGILMEQTHTIKFVNDLEIKVVGETQALIKRFDKFNEEHKTNCVLELFCNKFQGKKILYRYFFTLPGIKNYRITCRPRYRDIKHTVNLGNSVWDSPYAIPLEDF